MYITMYCGGMPFNGDTIKTEALGGSETAAYYVARELANRGHSITLFTNSQKEGIFEEVKYVFAGNVSDNYPLGDRFHYYAENTPTDVLIIQRHPLAFQHEFKAKLKLWWLHDLALIRMREAVQQHLWNINSILTVSEFHANQVSEVYGIPRDNIFAWQNGIDLNLWGTDKEIPKNVWNAYEFNNETRFRMLYAARPERGLENLVKPNGIMERLLSEYPDAHLYVCGYENTVPQMEQLYGYLFSRCDQLPNVTRLGALTKQDLATFEEMVDLYVYPTTFEDTYCLMAAEASAAGLPFLASHIAALPRTCNINVGELNGSILLPLTQESQVDINQFTETIINIAQDQDLRLQLRKLQSDKASQYSWGYAVDKLEEHIEGLFDNYDTVAIAKECLANSDIETLYYLPLPNNYIAKSVNMEFDNHYGFSKGGCEFIRQHYTNYELSPNSPDPVKLEPISLANNLRYITVRNRIKELQLPVDSVIADIGCHYGEYSINLAKDFPQYKFIGFDFLDHCIEYGRHWAKEDGLKNVEFRYGDLCNPEAIDLCKSENVALYLAAEVLEHLPGQPWEKLEQLIQGTTYKDSNPWVLITTPWGQWEKLSYERTYPYRFHLHHLDRADLVEIFGEQQNFDLINIPEPGIGCGSYLTIFKHNNKDYGSIDYNRKLSQQAPRETISLCIIAKDAENDIKRMLDSVVPFVDEVIVGIDKDTTDETQAIIQEYEYKGGIISIQTFLIDSPAKVGFDNARNEVIKKASGNWILWIDTDEYLFNGKGLQKYLQQNCYNGYAIAQHHVSADPPQIIKVDFPVRLFRNNKGIKFYGHVHEHPEIKMNEGVGHAMIIPDVRIMHSGYTHEGVRRNRFDRNINLLAWDREDYPDRWLGEYLWLRDLAQMSQYEMEHNGGRITEDMRERAHEGIEIWRDLLEKKQIRMCIDGLQFYSVLVQFLGKGFHGAFKTEATKNGQINLDKARLVEGIFANKEDMLSLFNSMVEERTKEYDSKYF